MDEASFEKIYDATASGLWSYLYRSCGDRETADDLFQETFLRFIRADPSRVEVAEMKPYLYKIATSVLTNHWRKMKRAKDWNLRAIFRKADWPKFEMATDMESVFQELKPQDRALLWLAYVEGYEQKEIARALGFREKSVRVLLFRARRKLVMLLSRRDLGPEVET